MGSTTRDLWEDPDHAQRYDEACNRHFYRSVMAELLRNAPELEGRGMDLGCGSGFSSEVLLDACPHMQLVGVDASKAMLRAARTKVDPIELPLVHADAARLPFAEDTFDVVVTSFAWHWFSPGAGAEIRRVLKPGGLLLAAVPIRQPSNAIGNRLLAKAVLAQRGTYRRRDSRGLRMEGTLDLLPGPSTLLRREAIVIEEIFRDSASMLEHLESRGALAAIFDETPREMPTILDPVTYAWPFAVVHARKT